MGATGARHLLMNFQRPMPASLAVEVPILVDLAVGNICELAREGSKERSVGIAVIAHTRVVDFLVAILEDLQRQTLHLGELRVNRTIGAGRNVLRGDSDILRILR